MHEYSTMNIEIKPLRGYNILINYAGVCPVAEINYKLTVLCTAFNHEKYIAQALESFVSQKTDFAFQVLVNDDCSTDGTAAILRQYAEKYPDIIKPIYQEKNLFSEGLAALYQKAFFDRLDTPYVAFCEADDYWSDESKLQRQMDILEADSTASACVHNTMLHYCAGGGEDTALLPEGGGDRAVPFETVIKGMSGAFHTSSIMARTEFVKNPPDYYYAAATHGFLDYAMALRLALCGKIRFIDRCMSVYRISSNPAAWSAKLDRHYARLKEFITGELAMMEKLLPHLNSAQRECTEKVMCERRYELYDIEGKVHELIKPPYLDIFRAKSFSYRLKTRIKILCPAFHRWYRKRQGYGDY